VFPLASCRGPDAGGTTVTSLVVAVCRATALSALRIIRAAPEESEVASGGVSRGRVVAATVSLSGGVRLARAVRLASLISVAGGCDSAAWLPPARRRLGATGGGVASQIAFRR